MTGIEIQNFYSQDEKKYLLNQNSNIVNYIMKMKNEGIFFMLDIDQIEKMMKDIVHFFEFKYPNSFLSDLIYNINHDENVKICQELAKALDINQLKFRLRSDYVNFLDCPYGQTLHIQKEKKKFWDWTSIYIHIDNDGYVNVRDLQILKEQEFIHNIEGIQKISDLLGRFIESSFDVDYSEITKTVITHKANIQLRNIILNLIPLKMIYSKSTLPEYGYIRAKSFVRMFNKEYGLNIDMQEVENIMKADYSNEKIKQKILG